MGKPIAGQNQFPYTVGGFLVDGANINGVTYAKKLYIYKQRSYDMYDLQDVDGNIFRFIRLGYKDTSGNMLNYFDVDESLVETIPVNTFFLKIQDPARNIFSFVRIYQWHKCITVEGDYVYRTSDIDPELSGVLINPTVSTIQVGNSLSYKSLFFPSNYPNLEGSWHMNSLDGIRDGNSAQILSTNLNTAVVKGLSLGKAVLTFVPKSNDALVTHSIINVIEETPTIEDLTIKSQFDYTCFKTGEEYTLNVVTYPYDAILTEALDVTIQEAWNNQTTTTLVSISEDFKSYTFKSILNPIEESEEEQPDDRLLSISFAFSMTDPIEFSFEYYETYIASESAYNDYYAHPGLSYYPPRGLRPNMTWQCKANISGPNQTMYPYVSSDVDIATFDYQTGIITTHTKTGVVSFSTQYDKMDGSGTSTYDSVFSMVVREDMYDYITCDPQQVDVVTPGQEFKVTFTGYREGQDPVNIGIKPRVVANSYSLDASGNVKVFDNATLGGYVYISPDVTLDYQVIATYNSTGIQPTIRSADNLVPMTSIETIQQTYYLRYSDNPNIDNWDTIMAYNRPSRSSAYQMQIDSYDDTIVELIDKDTVTEIQQYSMGGSLYLYINGLKRGSTKLIVSSIANPSIKASFNIVVY